MKTIKQLLSMLDHFLFPKPTCEEKAVIDRINLGMGICLASLTLLVSLYIPVWSVMTEQKDAIEIIGLVLIQITSILFLLYAWSRWKNRSIATKIPWELSCIPIRSPYWFLKSFIPSCGPLITDRYWILY